MSADANRVQALFRCALSISHAERETFLDRACAGDASLRSRLNELLAAFADAGSFLEDSSPAPIPTCDRLHGERQVGPYTLGRTLGEGGMGVVWAAEQYEPIRRTVALKLVKVGMDTVAVLSRFELERQVLARLNHPNIAHVLDAGQTEDGHPYFAMELVDGVAITRYCDSRDMPLRGRLDLFTQVCQAVQYAHQKGVIHRDLKPSNLLVAEVDGRPVAKVIDFGIAKAVGEGSRSGSPTVPGGGVLGTIEYMAPEQAEPGQQDIDTRTDVYALGAVLYELLVGRPPLSPKEPRPTPLAEALRRVREEAVSRPSSQVADPRMAGTLFQELDWVVMKALEKDRDRRYATVGELAADIQRYLCDEPVAARPPGRGYRLRKFVRRNRVPVAAAALIALALVGGAAAAAVGVVIAKRAERDAVAARGDAVEQRKLAERQAEAAEAAAVEARTSSEAAFVALEFIRKNVFSAARPVGVLGGRGRDVTLAQAINAAVPLIAKDFAKWPGVEARVRHWIGQSYITLGEPEKAAEQFRIALVRIDQARPTEKLIDRSAIISDLATTHMQSGRPSDVIALLGDKVGEIQARLGADHHVALAVRGLLGMAYDLEGDSDRAVGILEPLAADFARVRGREHTDTRYATSVLLLAYSRAGRTEDVERLIRASNANPNDLNTQVAVASAHLRAGRPGRAVEIYRRLLPRCEATLGRQHPSTLDIAAALGAACVQADQRSEGVERLTTASEAADKHLEPNHPTALRVTTKLAQADVQVGRLRSAAERLERVVLRYQATPSISKVDSLPAVAALAEVYLRLGRPHDAAELLERWIPDATTVTPRGLHILAAQTALAAAYTSAGRPADSFRLLTQITAALPTGLPTDHPVAVEVRIKTAAALGRLGRPEEAVRLLAEVVTSRTATLGQDHPGTLTASAAMAHAYWEAGRKGEAAELFERVHRVSRAVFGSRHPDTMAAAVGLAMTHNGFGRFDPAIDLLAETVPLLRDAYGDEHPDVQAGEMILGVSYQNGSRKRVKSNHAPELAPPPRLVRDAR